MAEIAKVGTPSYSQHLSLDSKITGLYVGEDIGAGDACRIASDGKIYRADGSGTSNNVVSGFATKQALVAQGDTLTLVSARCNWGYGSGLTPGALVYLSGTVLGGLADAATTGGTTPCGQVINSQQIRLWPSYK